MRVRDQAGKCGVIKWISQVYHVAMDDDPKGPKVPYTYNQLTVESPTQCIGCYGFDHRPECPQHRMCL